MKYRITQAGAFLYGIGVSYHATGILKDKETGKALFDYYKADIVTEKQKKDILLWCKHAQFFGIFHEYAPELSFVFIAFPKVAYYKKG